MTEIQGLNQISQDLRCPTLSVRSCCWTCPQMPTKWACSNNENQRILIRDDDFLINQMNFNIHLGKTLKNKDGFSHKYDSRMIILLQLTIKRDYLALLRSFLLQPKKLQIALCITTTKHLYLSFLDLFLIISSSIIDSRTITA